MLTYRRHRYLTRWNRRLAFALVILLVLLAGWRICREYGVEYRLTKPAHPWTNGQVERLNRPIKEATVQRFHYQNTAELNEHLPAFLLAYTHGKRLKTLRGLTPHEFICAQ